MWWVLGNVSLWNESEYKIIFFALSNGIKWQMLTNIFGYIFRYMIIF